MHLLNRFKVLGFRLTYMSILMGIALFFSQCSKAEVDTSQVRPAPPHASEMEEEDPGEGPGPAAPTVLFPVGGGTTHDELLQTFLDQSPVENPSVLLIPYAYDRPANQDDMQGSITRFRDQFTALGIQDFQVLDLTTPAGALQQIRSADVIWISGGFQGTLRNRLNECSPELIPAIKAQYETGKAILGGTSAGAAIMTETMINGGGGHTADNPGDVQIQDGAGFWPEVIIDQHFTQRNRMWRLENAISRYPDLIGIGLDESTAALYKDQKTFTVVGVGTITVLRIINNQQEITILQPGDVYTMPD